MLVIFSYLIFSYFRIRNGFLALLQVTDAKAKRSLQEQLAALQKQRDQNAAVVVEKKMAVRYHKVKFFGAPKHASGPTNDYALLLDC